MGAITAHVYKSLESYWRQRTYKKLESSSESKKRVVRLGDGDKRARRSWKVKTVRPLVRIHVVPSPLKLLVKLRDAYIKSMLAIAGEKKSLPSTVVVKKGGRETTVGQVVPKALRSGSVRGDFDKKMMVHIYNNLVAHS